MKQYGIKICGIDTGGLEATNRALIALDSKMHAMVGFVFYPHSPRYLTPDTATSIAACLNPKIARVALLVDPNDDAIDTAHSAISPQYIQLHGDESPARLCDIKARTGLSLIKSFAIESEADFAQTDVYENIADFFLFEPKASNIEALPGGRGQPLDWHLTRTYHGRTPWMLAGGLTSKNVGDAVEISGTRFVDVSSGVESTPGVKDPQKIVAFVENFIDAIQTPSKIA